MVKIDKNYSYLKFSEYVKGRISLDKQNMFLLGYVYYLLPLNLNHSFLPKGTLKCEECNETKLYPKSVSWCLFGFLFRANISAHQSLQSRFRFKMF